jgi:uncharacterized coiled-coil DUF342 family protein
MVQAVSAHELLAEVDRQREVIRSLNGRCDHLGMSLRDIKAERDELRAVVREVVDYFDAPDEGCFSDEAMERARAALKERT